jgi:hypothetical protein
MDLLTELGCVNAAPLAQSLCRGCGLCCDGTLFELAKIKPDDDVVQLKKVGITTICDDGGKFALPCASFDKVCTIYGACRPSICSGFLCELLKRYNKSETLYEVAAEIIRQAQSLKYKVHASFLAAGVDNVGCLAQQYRSVREKLAESRTRECVVAEFNYSVLQIQLNRYFRKNLTKHEVVLK